jgi:hypothetical protein
LRLAPLWRAYSLAAAEFGRRDPDASSRLVLRDFPRGLSRYVKR